MDESYIISREMDLSIKQNEKKILIIWVTKALNTTKSDQEEAYFNVFSRQNNSSLSYKSQCHKELLNFIINNISWSITDEQKQTEEPGELP